MEYNDQEYLNLFKQVKEQSTQTIETRDYSYEQLRGNANSFNTQMLKETPDYSNYTNYDNFKQQNINEVQRSNYTQDYNLNEFIIETRINGENINEVKKQGREDRLNEVMEKFREERLNAMKKEDESRNLNETINFKDADYISLEMFEKARYNSMIQVYNRLK
jgi:hypothetical protein